MAVANFIPPSVIPYNYDPPTISILSPANKTYDTNFVSLNFTVTKPASWYQKLLFGEAYEYEGGIYEVRCELDGAYVKQWQMLDSLMSPLTFSEELTGLCEGTHIMRVHVVGISYYCPDIWQAFDQAGNPSGGRYSATVGGTSDTIYFTVDTTPPLLSNLSVENRAYNYNETIPLIFAVNELTSWVGYSVDGQANVTLAGNITLAELPCGWHTVILYANDTAGNTGTSETIYFTIAEEIEAKPFPITLVIAASLIVGAVVSLGLIVYFRKRKR